MSSSIYSAAPICQNLPINKQITNDLKKEYKNILEKHLDGRIIKEDKINTWMNNILIEAKNYFTSKYPDYDLFLYITISPKNIYFWSKSYSISLPNIDWCDNAEFITNDLVSGLYFFFYKHYNLNYELEDFENEIIQSGNSILKKYLQDRKFGDECDNYGDNINEDLCNYILSKNNQLRCYFFNIIFKCPINNKYFFRYLSHGKQIYSKIIQTYKNDSLECCQFIFFFK